MRSICLYQSDKSDALKNTYNEINESFSKKLIYHVGTEAGLFSELNNMLYTMMWCINHNIKFILYADDANFGGKTGWEELFETFCPLNHDKLNIYGNYRRKGHFRYKRVILPNLLFRRIIIPLYIKKRNSVDYLTQDVFTELRKRNDLDKIITIEELEVNGSIRKEFVKFAPIALKLKKEITNEIEKMIKNLNLPEHYISIQIRSGDKIYELQKEYDVDYCSDYIEKFSFKDNIFVFTDNYSNVIEMQKKYPTSHIYTLTKKTETGYYNEEFNNLDWKSKRSEIIKLLAIMVVCLDSDMHFGYSGTCTDDYLRNSLPSNRYTDMNTYHPLNYDTLYYIRKFLKRR